MLHHSPTENKHKFLIVMQIKGSPEKSASLIFLKIDWSCHNSLSHRELTWSPTEVFSCLVQVPLRRGDTWIEVKLALTKPMFFVNMFVRSSNLCILNLFDTHICDSRLCVAANPSIRRTEPKYPPPSFERNLFMVFPTRKFLVWRCIYTRTGILVQHDDVKSSFRSKPCILVSNRAAAEQRKSWVKAAPTSDQHTCDMPIAAYLTTANM